jgi:hypothetical protein
VIWLIIGLIFLLLIGWLLLAPLEVCINSNNHDYHIKWKGIGEARVVVLPMDLLLTLQVAFWKKDWSVMEFKFQKDKKETKKSKIKKPKKSKKSRKMFRFFKRIMSSFTVEKLRVNIDTSNYILNGYLFPIFFHISYFFKGKPSLTINYKGKTEINVLIRNRLINMLLALVKRG